MLLREIAREIEKGWAKVGYAARPYLDALHCLDTVRDNYGADSGAMMVGGFLANAGGYKGPKAKELKAALKAALKGGAL